MDALADMLTWEWLGKVVRFLGFSILGAAVLSGWVCLWGWGIREGYDWLVEKFVDPPEY